MTWLIITLVVVAVLLVALYFLVPRRRQARVERQRVAARDHLQDSQRLAAQAEQSRAAADEMAARGRRERAELAERLHREEAEAQQLAARAQEQEAEAERLRERARALAPDLDHDGVPDRVETPDAVRTDEPAEAGVLRTDHSAVPADADVRADHLAAYDPDGTPTAGTAAGTADRYSADRADDPV